MARIQHSHDCAATSYWSNINGNDLLSWTSEYVSDHRNEAVYAFVVGIGRCAAEDMKRSHLTVDRGCFEAVMFAL